MLRGNASCICAPVIYPTSSASLLIAADHQSCSSPCVPLDPGATFSVLMQRLGPASEETGAIVGMIRKIRHHSAGETVGWEELAQTSGGRHLPLEIGAVRCRVGCRFKLRALHDDDESWESEPSEVAVTPMPAKHPLDLHIDARGFKRGSQRIEFFVRPPLLPVTLDAARAFVDGFAGRLHVRRERFVPIEISVTGAPCPASVPQWAVHSRQPTGAPGPLPRGTGRFLLVDILEQDLYEYVSGMWIREIFDKVTEVADGVNISGHTFDRRFGIWVQSPNTWTLDERSNLVWPDVVDPRQGPMLWTFLSVFGAITVCTVVAGVHRVLTWKRRPRVHGDWSPSRPRRASEGSDADGYDEGEEEDLFTRLSHNIVL